MANRTRPDSYDSFREALEAVRADWGRRRADRQAVASALSPDYEADPRMTATFAESAGLLRLDVMQFADPAARPRSAAFFSRTTDRPMNPDELLSAALALLFPDQLLEVSRAALAALYETSPPGLPRAERETRLAEIDQELGAFEGEEEALIEAAEAAGYEFGRRQDADARVILAGDPAGKTPAERWNVAKFNRIRERARQLHDVVLGVYERWLQANKELGRARDALARAEKTPRYPFPEVVWEPRGAPRYTESGLESYERAIRDAETHEQRLRAERDAAQRPWREAQTVVSRLEEFLVSAGVTIEATGAVEAA